MKSGISIEYRAPQFRSFWLAGYECADHVNKFGNRVDLLKASGHLHLLEQDYQAIRAMDIHTVREGIRWSIVEPTPYQYDWTEVIRMIEAGRANGIQQIWDICHFGFPDDLTPLHPHFVKRFVSLCSAFIQTYRNYVSEGPLYIVPINEISFLSWLGGDANGTAPFCNRQGWDVKYHLCRAFIEGAKALREADDNIIILATEPLINVVASDDSGIEDVESAARVNENQFQALDIITGRMCPELSGSPDLLDIVGLNFYYCNQWDCSTSAPLPWAAHDVHEGWQPLHLLLQKAFRRYQKPILLAETSHPGIDRPLWISHVADECGRALEAGIPLLGICLYPIIARPDWDFPDEWHHSGLWDEAPIPDSKYPQRILYAPYAEAIQRAQQHLSITPHSELEYYDSAANNLCALS